MVFDAFRVWADLVVTEKLQVADPMASMASRDESSLLLEPESLNEAILDCYDVAMDDERMRDVIRACESAGLEKAERALAFDRLRKEYPVRREFSHYRVDLSVEGLAQYLSLGFVIA
jgi:erythronate-4-phosphate dehydrogenase